MRTRSCRQALTLFGLLVFLFAGCGGDGNPTEPTNPPPAEDTDRDNDGILNAQDVCPDEPETLNGLTDGDGCPDSTLDFYNLVREDVEAVWAHLFNEEGETYSPLSGFSAFLGSVSTACGSADVSNGPFYCPSSFTPPRGNVYFPTAFMDDQLVAYGEGGPAVVIAHEIGHHITNLLGILELKALGLVSTKYTELQADCWAGVYAWSVEQRGFLEQTDMEGAARSLVAASDPGYTWFDPNGHGTPEQRVSAFLLGYESGIRGSCLTLTDPEPPPTMSYMTTGEAFTCGLTSNGEAYCWGLNSQGQLGDGTQTDRALPEPVLGGVGMAFIVAGPSHTCGLTASGEAYCWGENSYGMLGNGDASATLSTQPSAVVGGLQFIQLAAGLDSSCGLTPAGTAYCWGHNDRGQLGTGTDTNSLEPVPVSGGVVLERIVGGRQHTCSLDSSGVAYCWGDNQYGQIGNGTQDSVWMPSAVSGELIFKQIDAGARHSCGVSVAGLAYCWGNNAAGQLGDGTHTSSSVPVAVTGGLTFAQVSAGYQSTCGLTTEGKAYCWGYGSLGNSADLEGPAPLPVAGILTFDNVSVGVAHSCAVTTEGVAYCWGDNTYGELGTGGDNYYSVPTPVSITWE